VYTVHQVLAIATAAALVLIQESQRFTVDVSLVTVDVAVTLEGKPFTLLSEKDFRLFEDGVPQALRSFEASPKPLHILAVSPQCGGISDSRFQQMFLRFVRGIQSADRLALAEFSPEPKLIHDWNSIVGAQAVVPLPQQRCAQKLSFFRGLDWILSKAQAISGRKAVVWFNPDLEEISKMTLVRNPYSNLDAIKVGDANEDPEFQRALKLITNSKLEFHFVTKTRDVPPLVREMQKTPGPFQFDTDLMDQNERRQLARLKQLAEVSGGKLIVGTGENDIRPIVDQLNRGAGTSYTLSYAPTSEPKDSRIRRIEVRVSNPKMTVWQSRSEYSLSP
jgi:hypothetical protein